MKTTFARPAASQLALAVALFAGAASAETLTLYTSQPEADATKTVEAFKKLDAPINLAKSGVL